MKLYYYEAPRGNFGDDLNPWLWPQLFPGAIDDYFDDDTLFIGIGTLLNDKIPNRPRKKIVFGSGCGYRSLPSVTEEWHFVCVRGPLTAKMLDLPETTAISDSALLLRELREPADKAEYGVSFMPHHVTTKYDDWKSVCESQGIHYIDPSDPVEQSIESIRKSSLVITEAMHGAIVADALRVPWIPVRTRPYILDFKWQDWSATVRIQHEFEWLPRAWSTNINTSVKRALHPLAARLAGERLRWLARFGKRRLSKDAVFQTTYNRLVDTFYSLAEQTAVL